MSQQGQQNHHHHHQSRQKRRRPPPAPPLPRPATATAAAAPTQRQPSWATSSPSSSSVASLAYAAGTSVLDGPGRSKTHKTGANPLLPAQQGCGLRPRGVARPGNQPQSPLPLDVCSLSAHRPKFLLSMEVLASTVGSPLMRWFCLDQTRWKTELPLSSTRYTIFHRLMPVSSLASQFRRVPRMVEGEVKVTRRHRCGWIHRHVRRHRRTARP